MLVNYKISIMDLELNHTVILLSVFFVAVVLLVSSASEGFYTRMLRTNKYCKDCGNLSRYACGSCTNCGYCTTPGQGSGTPSGRGECIPGGPNGPYFREDCQNYHYGKPYRYSTWLPQMDRWSWWGPRRYGRVRYPYRRADIPRRFYRRRKLYF